MPFGKSPAALLLLAAGFMNTLPASPLRYSASDGAVIGRNLPDFNNRPLYVGNTAAFILTGDRPLARFCRSDRHNGVLMLALQRGGEAFWLHEAAEVVSAFRAGAMTWTISDPRAEGLELVWEVVPSAGTPGFASRVSVRGARPGDRLLWAYGGASAKVRGNLNWELDALTHAWVRRMVFDPGHCSGDRITLDGRSFRLQAEDDTAPVVSIAASHGEPVRPADASAWAKPAILIATPAASQPLATGVIPIDSVSECHWSVTLVSPNGSTVEPAEAYRAALARNAELASRLEVRTPDEKLNAAAGAVAAALDGIWYPPSFVHGAMLWSARYPGWRTTCGATVAGWHDRVLEQARYYLGSQVKDSKRNSFALDAEKLLTKAALDSRFYGRGRIERDHGIYNMQTQLFAQLIQAWRWTGDADLEKLLRPALELHLEWMQECFDPDLDGTYESYINTWPTDSIWFSGGGTPDETAYAYMSHIAARDLARRADDAESVKRHEAAIERIRNGFRQQLWNADHGHPGLVREQLGHRRLKLDPWLYGIFLPVDSGIVSGVDAVTTLRYSEWALQNDPSPAGGRRVWTSNFVPGIWSVRELWPGDNYHLALAYFQAGLPEEGWNVLQGTFKESAFNQAGPGNLGSPQGGTDFGDCINPFARTLVEGLFGYRPDYPNGIVHIAPGFPSEWEHAALRTPDFSLGYARRNRTVTLDLNLARPAEIEAHVPVRTTEVRQVRLNGSPTRFALEAGFGHTVVVLRLPAGTPHRIEIETSGHLPEAEPLELEAIAGAPLSLRLQNGPIASLTDPQGLLTDHRFSSEGVLSGTARYVGAGHATLIAEVLAPRAPRREVVKVRITDPAAAAAREAASVKTPPADARWETVPLAGTFNADIRKIHKQEYLHPRPATISVRIGTDGFSPWTFPHWRSVAPEIHLDGVSSLLDPAEPSRLKTPQGVPFHWHSMDSNIAFTSLWDNYPDRITVPIGRRADAAYFLVAGSTNVMQNRIANAVLRLRYDDGSTDELELIPPFNFWNLSPIRHRSGAPGQNLRPDYTDPMDAFAVPQPWPERVQLGENCRAILLNRRLRQGRTLESVTLETLSPEVVIGLMGITLLNPVD